MTRTDPRLARAALSRIMEPSDLHGLAVIRVLGPWESMRIISRNAQLASAQEEEIAEVLSAESGAAWKGIDDCLKRWSPRLPQVAAERDLTTMASIGGGLLIPEDAAWPAGLKDLGLAAPIGLWFRGTSGLPALLDCVAVVGSRDSTAYGNAVVADIAHGLVARRKTVLSGGAYGIDAAAHRAALTAKSAESVATIAVMAGGLDRFYPAGNELLLREISQSGLLLAEVPPGCNPTRYRFLQRNRLIAALSSATVVIEARWRSGALNTAHHAAEMGRHVAAVPGSVYSANSAGCHRLLREGAAVCVSDAAEICELISPSGFLPPMHIPDRAEHDGLPAADLLLLDALPVRRGSSVAKLAGVAGLDEASVRAGLGRLELLELAKRSENGWLRRRPSST